MSGKPSFFAGLKRRNVLCTTTFHAAQHHAHLLPHHVRTTPEWVGGS
jgi:hypothetical protein